jgi:hypothetical protein
MAEEQVRLQAPADGDVSDPEDVVVWVDFVDGQSCSFGMRSK